MKKVGKTMKGVGLLHRLQCFLPSSNLLNIYISFIRPHLDGDVIYNQPSNTSFSSKTEYIQYYVVLITEDIKGSSCEKLVL